MNDKVRKAVEDFIAEADRREVNRYQFFASKGLSCTPVSMEDERRSPVIVYEGREGTVVPPIRLGLGFVTYDEILPQYFYVRNHVILDPIKGWEITKLPVVEFVLDVMKNVVLFEMPGAIKRLDWLNE